MAKKQESPITISSQRQGSRRHRQLHERGRSLLHDHGYFAVRLARGLYDDLHVLAKRGEEFHEAFDGEGAGAVAHQCRNVRLLDAENLSRFRLLEAASLDEAVDLQREPGLQ